MPKSVTFRRTIAFSGTVALGLGLAGAASASAAPSTLRPATGASCETWQDANTWGMACGGHTGSWYQAEAKCNNGSTQYGPAEYGTSWTWSYAYCSANGGLFYGEPIWIG